MEGWDSSSSGIWVVSVSTSVDSSVICISLAGLGGFCVSCAPSSSNTSLSSGTAIKISCFLGVSSFDSDGGSTS